MSDLKRRRIDVLTDDAYLEGIGQASVEDLKQMRDDCRDVENEVSFERRLCQGRIDILSAELDHRAGRAGDVISRLPEILADEMSGPDVSLPSRAQDRSIPDSAGIPRRRVEEIAGEQTLAKLGELSEDEITQIIERLAAHERNLSQRRKKLHDVLDRIQAEIVSRYSKGEANPDSMLR